MGNEELFKRISTDISITNMFIGFKIDTKDKILPSSLLPKPEFTVTSRSDQLVTCMSRISIEETQQVFNNKVDEVKPVTSQKSSGRCWIFAVMNAMRIPFMKKLEIEDFEFSQSYLFFWDKIERSNYFLNTIGKYLQIVTRV